MSNKSDTLGSRTVQKERQKELQESSVLHTGEPHFSNAPAASDFQEQEESVGQPTDSTPSVRDSLDIEGTEGKAETIPTETTRPVSTNEAWAMMQRGEITQEQLIVLLAPAAVREGRSV